MSSRKPRTRKIDPGSWGAGEVDEIATDLGLELTEEQIEMFIREHADEVEQDAIDTVMSAITELLTARFKPGTGRPVGP